MADAWWSSCGVVLAINDSWRVAMMSVVLVLVLVLVLVPTAIRLRVVLVLVLDYDHVGVLVDIVYLDGCEC